MNKKDIEMIEKLSSTHQDLKNLWEEHVLYEKQIANLESRSYLTSTEESQLKELKKQKLEGKTILVQKLQEYMD